MSALTANKIEMKEAVAKAKAFVLDLFADEHIENVELEEVDFSSSDKNWFVVLSIQKTIDPSQKSPLSVALQRVSRDRKTVRLNETGEVKSVTNFRPIG